MWARFQRFADAIRSLPGRSGASTGRPVVAVGGISRDAVAAAIGAHQLTGRIAAVVARDGADIASIQPRPALTSAARSLAALPDSGTYRLSRAESMIVRSC